MTELKKVNATFIIWNFQSWKWEVFAVKKQMILLPYTCRLTIGTSWNYKK